MLSDIAQPVVFGDENISRIRAIFARNNPKQRGLAMPVSAHKPHPFPMVELKADIFKQDLSAEALGQIFYRNHICLYIFLNF